MRAVVADLSAEKGEDTAYTDILKTARGAAGIQTEPEDAFDAALRVKFATQIANGQPIWCRGEGELRHSVGQGLPGERGQEARERSAARCRSRRRAGVVRQIRTARDDVSESPCTRRGRGRWRASGVVVQVLVDEANGDGALADGRCDALDRPAPDIADGEDARHAGFQELRQAP